MNTNSSRTRATVQLPIWVVGLVLLAVTLVPSVSTVVAVSVMSQPERPQRIVVYVPRQADTTSSPTQTGGHSSQLLSTDAGPVANPFDDIAKAINNLGNAISSLGDLVKPDKIIPHVIAGGTSAITGRPFPVSLTKQQRAGRYDDTNGANPPPLFTKIMNWLSHTPDFTRSLRASQFITGMKLISMGFILIAVAVLFTRYISGAEENITGAAGSILVCVLAIAAYSVIWRFGTGALNLLGDGIYSYGLQLKGWVDPSLVPSPAGMAVRAVMAVAEVVTLLIVGIARAVTLLLLGIAFLAGPLAIAARAFGKSPIWSAWSGVVFRSVLWPLVWSLEAAAFVLFTGMTHLATMDFLQAALFQPLLQIGLIFAMAKTPSWVNSGFAMAQPQVSRATNHVGGAANRYMQSRMIIAGGTHPAVAVGLAALGITNSTVDQFRKAARKGKS